MSHNEKSSIKVSIGDVSIAYEGSQSYIDSGLQDFIQSIMKTVPIANPAPSDGGDGNASGSLQKRLQHMSTNTIASNYGVKSGTDLVIAAIAHIQLVKGTDRAVRGDILAEMKGATTYYKSTFGGNLSAYLDSLVKSKKINLVSDNTYAMTANERSKMETLLAAN